MVNYLNLLFGLSLVSSISISQKREPLDINDSYMNYVGDLSNHKDLEASNL